MKKRSLLSILVLAMSVFVISSLQSCTKLGKNLHFNLPMQTGTATITFPASDNTTGQINIGATTIGYNVDSFIMASTANQLNSSNISSVKLTSLKLTLTNANTLNNFANLHSVNAAFTSNSNQIPYIVSLSNIADTYTTTIDLPVDTTELKSYLGNQFTYTINAVLRRVTSIPLNCTVNYQFSVVVQG